MRSKVFKTAKTTSQNSDKKESRLARRGAECKIMVAKQSFPDRPEKVSGGGRTSRDQRQPATPSLQHAGKDSINNHASLRMEEPGQGSQEEAQLQTLLSGVSVIVLHEVWEGRQVGVSKDG